MKNSKDVKGIVLNDFFKSGVLGEFEIHTILKYTFVVNKDLTITEIQSTREFNSFLFEKIKDITKSLKFKKPAYKNGKPVNVRVYIEFLVSTSVE